MSKNLKSIDRIFSRVLLFAGCIPLLLNSCAFDLHHVSQSPTRIESTVAAVSSFELEHDVRFTLDSSYSRRLNAGTKWNYVFTITQGDVYKTKDQILTVEASNIFEAYIVVSSNQLVGFYLPVEKTFSPLEDVQTLKMRGIN